MSLVRRCVCAGAVLLALPAAASAAETCPADQSAAFTIVSTEQPGPAVGTLRAQSGERAEDPAVMEVDVPGAGTLEIGGDDGGYSVSYPAEAAGRLSADLPISGANYNKYSGEREGYRRAGEAVTVGYTVTFTRSVPYECRGGDPNAPGPATTQTFSFTYKPYPVVKVRLALSTEAPGRYVGTLSCTNIHKVVCGRHSVSLYLDVKGEPAIDGFFTAKNGRLTLKLDPAYAREIKKKRRVKARLLVQFRGSTLPDGFAAQDDLAFNTLIVEEITLRKGKIPATVLIGTNVKGNKTQARGRALSRGGWSPTKLER